MALQPAPPELRQTLGGAYKWLVQLLRSLTTIQTQANSSLSVSGLTIQNNTPSGGKISWSASTVFYQGVAYPIAAGSTAGSELYVTWTVGASTFTPTNSFVPGPTLFVILVNNAGTGDITWDKVGAQSITTSQIANQAVTATQIANATITNVQIANATILAANIASVNASTITTGTLSAINITSCTLTASTLTLNSGNVTTTLSNGVVGSDIKAFAAANNTFSDCFATVFIGSASVGNPRGQFQCGAHGGAVGTLSPGTVILQDSSSNTFQVSAQALVTTASSGAATLPANPDHFLIITQNGTQYKIPCYNL